MKKIISLMLAIVLCVGMVPIAAVADETPTQTPITYLDKHGNEQTCDTYTELTAEMDVTQLNGGWYVVDSKLTYNTRILLGDENNPNTNLILCDGAELTINETIRSGGNLTIYAQKKGTGKLVVNGNEDYGIFVYGDLTINGGDITAKTKDSTNGKSSHYAMTAINITINGGKVTATTGTVDSPNYGNGENPGISANNIIIKNATVNATGGTVNCNNTAESYGIYAENGNVKIYNSTVTATGGKAQGNSSSQSCGIYAEEGIIVDNSTVVASADRNSANYDALCANGGEIHCENADLTFSLSQHMRLTGSFKKVATEKNGIRLLNDYLRDGYAFYDKDGKVVKGTEFELTNVTIAEHEHNYATELEVGGFYRCACGEAESTQSVAYVDYVDGEAVTKYTNEYEVVENATTDVTWYGGKTYVVNSSVTIDGTVQNGSGAGGINLILCDGAELKVNGSVEIGFKNLTIYGQKKGTGTLTSKVTGTEISSLFIKSGTLTINGGVINTEGGNNENESCGIYATTQTGYSVEGKVIINGGEIIATGGTASKSSYGICAPELEINGGKITVSADENATTAYGIYTTQSTTITGGEITLNAGSYLTNANISGGEFKGEGKLELRGDAENIKLSGGNFGVYFTAKDTDDQYIGLLNVLADGYAAISNESNEIYYLLNCDAIDSITIKSHNCTYTFDEVYNDYRCDCGRSTTTKPISYIDENGDTKWCLSYFTSSSGFVDGGIYPLPGNNLWYVYDSDHTRTLQLPIRAGSDADNTLNIILCDGVEVNFKEGILLNGNDNYYSHLNIYAQSTGDKAGKLTIDKGIRDNDFFSSTVTINGGNITVNADTSTEFGAAINTGYLTMNGGTLTANGEDYTSEAYGIYIMTDFVINGGTLNANAGNAQDSSIAMHVLQGFEVNGGTLNTKAGESNGASAIGTTVLTVSAGKINPNNELITAIEMYISGGEVKLPIDSGFGQLELGGKVTLKDLLPSGCAIMQKEKVYDGNKTWTEDIGYVPLSSKTPLERYWADEEYQYDVVECNEHSGSPCTYCGYKKKVNSGSSEPTLTPTVTQPATGGKIEISNTSPTAGEVITVTPKADDGYTVDKIIVKDANGNTIEVTKNSDGSYSFTQPDTEVTVEVTFKPLVNFKDVKEGDWYEEAVNFVVANGIMNGVSENYFYPNFKITRGMFATVLYNLAGKPEVTITNTYSDVKSTEYYAAPIAWATEMGIVNGMPSGKFLPNEPITREQMVKMLWVYLGKPEANSNLSQFPDGNKVSDYAQTAMAWAVENGVITGRANGTLDPRGTATRAEAAKIFMNYLSK